MIKLVIHFSENRKYIMETNSEYIFLKISHGLIVFRFFLLPCARLLLPNMGMEDMVTTLYITALLQVMEVMVMEGMVMGDTLMSKFLKTHTTTNLG